MNRKTSLSTVLASTALFAGGLAWSDDLTKSVETSVKKLKEHSVTASKKPERVPPRSETPILKPKPVPVTHATEASVARDAAPPKQ